MSSKDKIAVDNRPAVGTRQGLDPKPAVNSMKSVVSLAITIILVLGSFITILLNRTGPSSLPFTLIFSLISLILTVIGLVFSLIKIDSINMNLSTNILIIMMLLSIGANANLVVMIKFPVNLEAPVSSSMSTPTNLVTVTNGSVIPTDQSILVPANQDPVLYDDLNVGDPRYLWDSGTQKDGFTCTFEAGVYRAQAPVGKSGGCYARAIDMGSNFVYQIKMKIRSGLSDGDSGAGLSFRASNGSAYQISFDNGGGWILWLSTKPDKPIAANYCYHFLSKGENIITVRVQGSQIEATVNNYDLFPKPENVSSLKVENIGVEVYAGKNFNADVEFSDARVWKLP